MRFREFKIINEAKGIFGRQPGDIFTSPNGVVYEFQSIINFPDLHAEGFEQFEDEESRDNAIGNLEDELRTAEPIWWANTAKPSMLAFAIAELKDDNGASIYWGRYFKLIKGSMLATWANKEIPPGFKLGTSGAKKSEAALKPQDLIGTEKEFSNIAEVFNSVKTKASPETQEVLVTALTSLATGSSEIEFPNMWDQQAALRDHFGEIMQPIALIGGVIKGAAEEAREDLADGADWADCKVTWPMSESFPLVDSILIAPNGQRIGVSTKGGKGANASIKNLYDAYKKAVKEKNVELLKTSKFTIDVANVITENTAHTGPVALAKFLKIRGIGDNIQAEIDSFKAEGKKDDQGLSPAAQKLFALTATRGPYETANVVLLGVAKVVAAKVNSNREFSRGALALLNQSSLIQIYTEMKKKGNNAVLASFKAVYPPTFDGHVMIDGTKNYTSKRTIGKFAFSFGNSAQLAKAGEVPQPKAVKKVAPKTPTKLSAAGGGTKKGTAKKGVTQRSKR